MTAWLGACAILGLLVPFQEERRIQDLIQRLEDDSFEVRERAERELVQAGEPAMEKLREAAARAEVAKDRGELLLRLRSALSKIELEQKARKVYAEPRPVSLRLKEVPLSEALAALGRETGIKMESSDVDLAQRVSIDAVRAPLLQVLDRLCAESEGTSYDYREAGVIRFLKQPHVACPAAYSGPFRVRVLNQRLERATDFKAKSALLHLCLDADYEKYLKPFRRYDLAIEKARDDSGRALEAQLGDESDEILRIAGGRWALNRLRIRLGARGAPVEPGQAFTLKGLTSASRRIWIEGTVKFSFPLDPSTVRFEKPAAGDQREAGEYSMKLLSQSARGSWLLRFTRRTPAGELAEGLDEDLEQRIDRDSLQGMDEDGKEIRGSFSVNREALPGGGGFRARALREDPSSLTYELDFSALGGKPLKELRFSFIDKCFVKTATWAIEGLELP